MHMVGRLGVLLHLGVLLQKIPGLIVKEGSKLIQNIVAESL